MRKLTKSEVARMIDHAILQPDTTQKELFQELELAHAMGVFSVCVRPSHVAYASEMLGAIDSSVQVGTVIGFPHGSQHHKAKLEEIRIAADEGATEVDIVLDLGQLKDARSNPLIADSLWKETSEQNDVATLSGIKKTKLILENAYLKPHEILMATKMGVDTGFDFIKTSTGFASRGATFEDLLIMKTAAAGKAELKASGGISNLTLLLEMYDFGVTRFGTSRTKDILGEFSGLVVDDSSDLNKY